ncbi:MAG: DUF655 domain-containing protein [Candidatus Aenigmarchaeota archaeon]|nr:DUF655 domain-containing protein [Candidatus Aenigmarchaeota archaeon]
MDKPLKKDDWGIVMDFLPHGHLGMSRPEPVAQVLGETYFSLLEVIVRDEQRLEMGERVYIGDDKRDKVKYIRERIPVSALTVAAREELAERVDVLVRQNDKRFIEFFNKSGQLTTRMHQLELLPGIGKKHLWAIIEARKVQPFESFEDIKKRVALLPDPEKMVVKRIMLELDDADRYRIFVPKFEKHQEREHHRF